MAKHAVLEGETLGTLEHRVSGSLYFMYTPRTHNYSMLKITIIICSAMYMAGTHHSDWLNTKIKVLGENALKFKVQMNPIYSH